MDPKEHLFSYGTLRLVDVQQATFGRRLEGEPDTLPGYRLVTITIADEEFVSKGGAAEHRNLQFTGNTSDHVEGIIFTVTSEELEHADAYEPDGYERVRVQLSSGIDAWVYLDKQQSK